MSVVKRYIEQNLNFRPFPLFSIALNPSLSSRVLSERRIIRPFTVEIVSVLFCTSSRMLLMFEKREYEEKKKVEQQKTVRKAYRLLPVVYSNKEALKTPSPYYFPTQHFVLSCV